MEKSLKLIMVGLLCFLIFSGLLAFGTFKMNTPSHFEVNVTDIQNGKMKISYSVQSGSLGGEAHIVAFPVFQKPDYSPLVIYYDAAYPFAVGRSHHGYVYGIHDHLQADLTLRKYPYPKVPVINASQLRTMLLQGNTSSILIMPTGAIPDVAYEGDSSLLKKWMEKGGTLIWLGESIGRYKAFPNGSLADMGFDRGQSQVLGFQLVSEEQLEIKSALIDIFTLDPGLLADNDSNISRALNLRYPIPLRGAVVRLVEYHGGLVLGRLAQFLNETLTSIAAVPVGNGWVILFGFGVAGPSFWYAEEPVASDIANIVSSGILYSTGQITWEEIILNKSDQLNSTITPTFGKTQDMLEPLIFNATALALEWSLAYLTGYSPKHGLAVVNGTLAETISENETIPDHASVVIYVANLPRPINTSEYPILKYTLATSPNGQYSLQVNKNDYWVSFFGNAREKSHGYGSNPFYTEYVTNLAEIVGRNTTITRIAITARSPDSSQQAVYWKSFVFSPIPQPMIYRQKPVGVYVYVHSINFIGNLFESRFIPIPS